MHDYSARDASRRRFLKWATHGLGALFGLLIGVPGVNQIGNARDRPAPARGMRRVAKLSELEIGQPKQVIIHDVRRDAWTLHPSDVVGRVWLVRQDQEKVHAFTTTCPHLGCSVDWRPDHKLFICPCHNGTFDPDGNLVERDGLNNPAPRGMDRLELGIVKDNASSPETPDFFIEVRYENFLQGEKEKIAKT